MSRRFIGVLGLVVSAALVGCASTNWEEVANERDRALRDQQASVDAMTLDSARAISEAEAAKTARAAAERDAQLAKQQREEAVRRAQEWQAAAENAKRAPAPAPLVATGPAPSRDDDAAVQRRYEELRRKVPKDTVVTITKDGNIEITLPSDVTFGSGKSELTDAGKKSVRGLAPMLNGEYAPYMIRVEGHTDAQPLKRTAVKFTDNFGLGSARALEVVRFMTSDMKIDAKRLMSASRGEQQPVAKGEKPTDMAKNRRVEIVVVIPRESAIAEAK